MKKINPKLAFAASKSPKFKDNDPGIQRRIHLQPRQHNKTVTMFDEACACIMRHNPKANRIVLLRHSQMPPLSGKKIVRKGRWYYFKWGKRLIYIKVIRVNMPEGFYETEVSRVHSSVELKPLDPEQIKKLTATPDSSYIGDAKIEWKVFKWEDKTND